MAFVRLCYNALKAKHDHWKTSPYNLNALKFKILFVSIGVSVDILMNEFLALVHMAIGVCKKHELSHIMRIVKRRLENIL